MISKLIVHAPDRQTATQELFNALSNYKVVGLPTNIKFLKRVLLNEQFKSWDFDTSFIAQNETELLDLEAKKPSLEDAARTAICNAFLQGKQDTSDPWAL